MNMKHSILKMISGAAAESGKIYVYTNYKARNRTSNVHNYQSITYDMKYTVCVTNDFESLKQTVNMYI